LPALRENCGDAGIYCSPELPHQSVQAIQNLMIKYYEYAVYPNNKLFNLIKFRDKIAPEKFIVEFSE
jgi:hypothetical protein